MSLSISLPNSPPPDFQSGKLRLPVLRCCKQSLLTKGRLTDLWSSDFASNIYSILMHHRRTRKNGGKRRNPSSHKTPKKKTRFNRSIRNIREMLRNIASHDEPSHDVKMERMKMLPMYPSAVKLVEKMRKDKK
jgi:hypothetical protein